ncbi:FAD binding domain-containing protein [Tistrella bauzanensis]|uniref:FAD binding domain-containing protein n=1 Tax=Tistrella TaxID=171436 RepID=UPI0031F6111F
MQIGAYHAPASLADAVRLLAELPDAVPLAGGMTLLPVIRQRLAAPDAVIDLGRIAGLDTIRIEDGHVHEGTRQPDRLVIGAGTTHDAVARSDLVATVLPALARLAGDIGDPAVRARGTIGGSLANNDPAADYPAAALALDAWIVTDRRVIAAPDFFQGFFQTALMPGEIVTAVSLAIPVCAGYAKLRGQASRFPVCGVFVSRFADGPRVAVTGAGSQGVFRATVLEQALAADWSPAAARAVRLPEAGLLGDANASPRYRAHLVSVLAARAIAGIIEPAPAA